MAHHWRVGNVEFLVSIYNMLELQFHTLEAALGWLTISDNIVLARYPIPVNVQYLCNLSWVVCTGGIFRPELFLLVGVVCPEWFLLVTLSALNCLYWLSCLSHIEFVWHNFSLKSVTTKNMYDSHLKRTAEIEKQNFSNNFDGKGCSKKFHD